jgi:hypothetical protein
MITKRCGCSTETCGCCEGIEKLTPVATANRPGLPALRYRVGTHGAFFETMKARLSNLVVEAPGGDNQTLGTFLPLAGLTTRDPSDPAIALLDGWAMVADVLTFYQERIANEGYLRTATERRSILELARLVGYTLRPGVASTVYLAYTLDEDLSATPPKRTAVTIPAGARVQSVPGPGELPQSFETSEDLPARSEWNNLQVRLTQPQKIDKSSDLEAIGPIYFRGIATGLKPNDPLLFLFEAEPSCRHVDTIETNAAENWTKVTLQVDRFEEEPVTFKPTELDQLVEQLQVAPVPQRASGLQLPRVASATFKLEANTAPRFLTTFNPLLRTNLYRAWARASVTAGPPLKSVGALKASAKFFGHNASAQLKPSSTGNEFTITALPYISNMWVDAGVPDIAEETTSAASHASAVNGKDLDTIALDAEYKVKPGEWIALKRAVLDSTDSTALQLSYHRVKTVESISMAGLGLTSRVSLLTLDPPWLPKGELVEGLKSTYLLRSATVYTQFEELSLAEEPIEACVGNNAEIPEQERRRIELRDLCDDLAPGRRLIVVGERTDVKDANGQVIPGIMARELVMLADIEQTHHSDLPNEKEHSTLILDKELAYCYKRKTIVIYGNVVKATQGETLHETLGSGNGSQAWQAFVLKQTPLTFVPAPTPEGVESTLHVYVNNVEWHETDSFAGLGPKDRRFITKIDDNAGTTVLFGNGINGSRLPTGPENVKAVYRNGIGKSGNVQAEQISLLQTRPLGVKAVINPLASSGGADKEDRDLARENAPIAIASLDRLVGLQDYADFARTFAGIAKARARRLSDGQRQLVHITIAGVDDSAIDRASDLYRNLVIALQKYGDEDLPVQVDLRELVVLMLNARVRLTADYLWEPVALAIRTALLDTFGFRKRSLAQPALLCEVMGAIQNVEGVAYVDVDSFGGIPEKTAGTDRNGKPTRRLLTLGELRTRGRAIFDPSRTSNEPSLTPAQRADAKIADFEGGTLRPAQLAIFAPEMPDTLILNQIT